MEMQAPNEKTALRAGRSRGDSIFVSPSMGAIEMNSADKVRELEADSLEARAEKAINASMYVNIILTMAKTYAALDSGSLAILSSLIDSVLDLFSIGIVKWTDKQAKAKFNHEFPAGQRRLEPLGVMVCAALMCMAALEVIRQAMETLFGSTPQDVIDDITLTVTAAAVVIASIIMKAILYRYCMSTAGENASVEALAQDHRNDVITNTCALLAVVIVEVGGISYWWVDSTGAALLSVWIVWGWVGQAMEQGEMLVGKGAGDEFIGEVETCADNFQAQVIPLLFFSLNSPYYTRSICKRQYAPKFICNGLVSVLRNGVSASTTTRNS